MEEPGAFKKTKRKIRCTQEFNQLHRKSIAITPKGSEFEKKISKKNNAFFYLPKVDIDFGNKENNSPNIIEKKLSKRKRQSESSSKDLFKNICNSDIKETWTNKKTKTTSMEGERKDSTEILFKKRKNKKKQLHLYFEEQLKTCSHEDLSSIKAEENSISSKTKEQSKCQYDIEQNFDTNDDIKVTRPRSTLNNLNEHPLKKSTLKTSSKSLSDLALSPIDSEYLSDNVFSDSFKLSDTLECNNQLSSGNNSKKSNTFELQNSIFDVSQLPVIPSNKKDLSSLENNGNKRLRSLNNEKNISKNRISVNNRKSVNIKKEKCIRSKSLLSGNSSKMNNASLCSASYSNRKSVRFTEYKRDQVSPISESNNSVKYRKSPYIRKLSSVRSKNPSISPEIGSNNLSQNKEHLFDISPNGTSTSFNETLETSSPTKSESKITIRKKWNRSLGVSILDSTGLIHTISPPWDIEESDHSFSFSYGRNSSLAMNLFDLNCQKIHSSQKKTSNCSTPTKISPIDRLGHLSNANINSPRNIPSVILNSVKQSKSSNTRVETLKWADSPIGKASSSKRSIQTDMNKANYANSNKKTKMPNFALIHQKAYDKLENLKDMTERKALRTKLLLSGRKPDIENLEVKSPRFKIKSPRSKKQLRFIPKKKSLDKLKEPQATSKTSTREEVAPSTSNHKVVSVKSLKNKIKSNIPKLTKKPLEDQKKGFTKLSLKSGTQEKKILKQEQINAIANKTKVVKNTIDTRRNAVQNVRSNRRFELLMKMRKGKN